MAVGVWDPKGPATKPEVDRVLLLEILDRIRRNGMTDLALALGPDLCRRGAALMQQPEAAWAGLQDLRESDLVDLVRFFTLAEEELAGWDAGKKSPVIPLVKTLRKREQFSADLRRWIKRNTKNRYLPYGSAG